MKRYFAFFKFRCQMGLQYRAAALGGIATQFAWGFMLIMLYKTFYEADSASFPMTFSALVSYIWLQQAFLVLFGTWMEHEIFDLILNGNIAYELCRPIRIYHMWFARSLASRISGMLLRCCPILLVAAFLPYPYGLLAPASFPHFVIFFITLLLGLMVTVAFCMLVYGLSFFTISPQGLRIIVTSVVEFFSGAVIPLPFFPENWQKVMELLPFAAMQNVALRVYSGDLSVGQMQRMILLQVIWLLLLTVGGSILYRSAEKKVVILGG